MLLKKKFAFSLIELLISLIVISCITAAFTPIITKKFSSGVFGGGSYDLTVDCTDKFGDFCTLCTSGGCIDCGISCPDGEYMDTKNCICLPCKDKYGEDCEKCNEMKCLTCPVGQYIDSDDNCQLCSDKFSNCATCTESECTSCADGYVLTDKKCEINCSKFGSNCANCTDLQCITCKTNYKLSKGYCTPDCENLFGPNCISCSTSRCQRCIDGYGGNKCTVYCSAKYGTGCIDCSDTYCEECANGFQMDKPSTNTACLIVDPVIMQVDNLWVTRFNAGDHPFLPIPADVSIVQDRETCNSSASNKCCWQGLTVSNSSYCDSYHYGGEVYSGCKRTVCNHYAAEHICKNLKYNNKSWRLPTKEEMKNWDNYSVGKNDLGLLLCNRFEGHSSVWCAAGTASCPGSKEIADSCYLPYIWSGDISSDKSKAVSYELYSKYWVNKTIPRTYALSVRCVTEL